MLLCIFDVISPEREIGKGRGAVERERERERDEQRESGQRE